MVKKLGKHSLLISAVYSLCLIISALFFFGGYLDSYESIMNYVCSVSAEVGLLVKGLSNNDFILFQVYMFLQEHFPGVSFLSIGKLFFTWLSLTIIFSFIISYSIDFWKKIILFLMANVVLISSVLFLNNVKVAFMMGASTLLLLYEIEMGRSKSRLLLYYTLVVLTALNRLEIALLCFGFGVLYYLLFFDKKKLIHSISALLLTLVFHTSFVVYNYTYYKSIYNIVGYEKAFDDRQNFKLFGKSLGELDNREDLETISVVLYTLDEPTLDMESYDFKSFLKYDSFLNYVFENPNFTEVYFGQLSELYEMIEIKYWPLLVSFIVLVMGVVIFMRVNSFFQIKFLFIVLVYLLVPFTAALFGNIPETFLSAYLSIGVLALFYSSIKYIGNPIFALCVLGLCTALIFTNLIPSLEDAQRHEDLTEEISENFNNESEVFMLSNLDWRIFSNKLFDGNKNSMLKSISFGFFDSTEPFRKQKEKIFGPGYASVKNRFDYLVKNQSTVYGSRYIVDYYKNYLKVIHEVELEFHELEFYDQLRIGKYVVTSRPL